MRRWIISQTARSLGCRNTEILATMPECKKAKLKELENLKKKEYCSPLGEAFPKNVALLRSNNTFPKERKSNGSHDQDQHQLQSDTYSKSVIPGHIITLRSQTSHDHDNTQEVQKKTLFVKKKYI